MKAPRQDHVMNMAAISFENRHFAEVAATYRKAYIEQWQGKGHKRCRHPEQGFRVLAPNQGEAAKHEADGKTSGVTQEDRRGAKVETKEGKEAGSERKGCEYQSNVAAKNTCEKHGDRGK